MFFLGDSWQLSIPLSRLCKEVAPTVELSLIDCSTRDSTLVLPIIALFNPCDEVSVSDDVNVAVHAGARVAETQRVYSWDWARHVIFEACNRARYWSS